MITVKFNDYAAHLPQPPRDFRRLQRKDAPPHFVKLEWAIYRGIITKGESIQIQRLHRRELELAIAALRNIRPNDYPANTTNEGTPAQD